MKPNLLWRLVYEMCPDIKGSQKSSSGLRRETRRRHVSRFFVNAKFFMISMLVVARREPATSAPPLDHTFEK